MDITLTLPDDLSADIQTWADKYGYADITAVCLNAVLNKGTIIAMEVQQDTDAQRLEVLKANPDLLASVDAARAILPPSPPVIIK